MRPLLVVEDERLVARRAEQELRAGHLDIAGQRASGKQTPRREGRRRVREGLPRVGERFVVHVLVEEREPVEIRALVRRRSEHVQRRREDPLQIRKRRGPGQQGQVPPRLVGNLRGIIQSVAIR